MLNQRARITRAVSAIAVAFVAAAIVYSVHPRAQSPADTAWVIEDVAPVVQGACGPDVLLNGLAFDAAGRLMTGWSERSACGGSDQASWGWRTGAGWQTQRFQPFADGSDARAWANIFSFALNGQGDPIAVFDSRYADNTHPDALWSFSTNLTTDPLGAAPVLFGSLDSISHHAVISVGRYVTRTAPDGTVRAARFIDGNSPRVLLDGSELYSAGVMSLGDYAVTPDGVDHIVFPSSSVTFLPSAATYLRHDASGTTVSTIRADASAVAIAADHAGNLHAFVEAGQGDKFGGNLEYFSSADSGATWSAAEVVDSSGSAAHAVAGVDRHGAPAVAYWRYGTGLFYATRASGVWQATQVWTPPSFINTYYSFGLQLAFDAANTPVIAFFDTGTSLVRIASPVPVLPPNRPPTLANPGSQVNREGDTVNLPIGAGAADADHDPLTFAATGLPPGLSIDANTGAVSGTLVFPSAGIYPVHASVSDGKAAAAVDFTWTVTHVVCNPIANPDTAVTPRNAAVDIQVLDNDIAPACALLGLNLAAVSTPRYGSATFDRKLSTVTYTPPTDFEGTDFFDYTIANSGGGSATAKVTVTVGTTSPIRVNTTAWIPQADGDCTLRQAIIAANTNLPAGGCGAGGSTPVVIVPQGTYTLLAIDNTTNTGRANGLPPVVSDVTLQGDGAAHTIIERDATAPAFGIFDIAPHGHYVTLSGVTVRGGDAADGGAIFNEGDKVTIADSWLTANHATGTGGAYADVDAKGGTLDATGSTFSDNTAGQGGAVKLAGGGSLVNVTASGNTADDAGGGLWVTGTAELLLRNVTIVANHATAGMGGGVFSKDAPVRLANSIVAGNSAKDGGPDLGQDSGHFDLIGFNLIGNGSGAEVTTKSAGDRVGTNAAPIDPLLDLLADNGGPTPTHLPLPGSPVIDAGNPTAPGDAAAACPAVDQRGIARPVDGTGGGIAVCDTGAVEVRPAEIVISDTTTALTASPNPATFGSEVTLTATVTPTPPGTRIPTGSVKFTEGPATLAVVTLSNGSATFKISSLTVGNHSLGAEYSGDAYFQPSQAVGTVTVQLSTPVVISIVERIAVADVATPLPSAMLTISESIAVQDSAAPLPSAMFTVTENIAVHDTPAPLPSALLTVTENIAVHDAPAPLPSAMFTVTENIAVHDAPAPLPSAMFTVNEKIAVADVPNIGNTPTGGNVVVAPVDPASGGTPVSLTFSGVISAGVTAVTTSSTGPAIPAGFALGTPPVYFDITTTAIYTPPITVCIDYRYDGVTFKKSSGFVLAHFEDGQWVTRTVPPIPGTTTVCMAVNSLSPFAIFEPANQPPVANAGPDQTVEATSPSSAGVTLNGSASSDSDGDTLTYQWTGPFGTRSGVTANVTLPLGTNTITLTVDDGNSGTSTDTVVVTVRDTIAPSVTIAFPASATYQFNQVVSASYVCADGGSGIATCAGPVPSGSPIDTGAEGQHAFAVTATDVAGNTTTKTVTYTVTGLEGRMTGDGEIRLPDGREHRFEFRLAERHFGVERGELHYTLTTPKSGKQKEKTDRFDTTSVGPITFWDDPAFRPGRGPKPTADSVAFSGTGTWNNAPGYTFEARAADEGEPAVGGDTFAITIRDRNGATVATASGVLTEGNIQSERLHQR